MDALGAVDSTLTLAKRVYQAYEYYHAVKDAPKTMRAFFQETKTVVGHLEWIESNLRDFIKIPDHPANERLLQLFEVDKGSEGAPVQGLYLRDKDGIPTTRYKEGPVIEELRLLLDKLTLELDPKGDNANGDDDDASGTKRKRTDTTKRTDKLGWLSKPKSTLRRAGQLAHFPIKEKELQAKLTQLLRLEQKLQISVVSSHYDISVRLLENQHSFDSKLDRIYERTGLDENDKIRKWLSPLNFEADYREQLDCDGLVSCDWLFKDDTFDSWSGGAQWDLFLYAEGGTGKTVVFSCIVEHLKRKFITNPDHAVLFVYLKHDDQKAQTVNKLMASLLKQLVMKLGPDSMPEQIRDFWKEQTSTENPAPPGGDVEKYLQLYLSQLKRTYILVDGVDEATETVQKRFRQKLTALRKGAAQDASEEEIEKFADNTNTSLSQGQVSLLYTSRRLEDLESKMRANCDQCSRENVLHYYVCKADNHPPRPDGHTGWFQLCKYCTATNQTCRQYPHFLRDPYVGKQIDMNLQVPPEEIEKYIEYRIEEELDLGAEDSSEEDDDDDYEEKQAKSWKAQHHRNHGTSFGRLIKKHPERREYIVDQIAQNSKGSFMLARLQWDHVAASTRSDDIEKAVNNLPSEFNEGFELTMKRIKKQGGDKAKRAQRLIMWVAFAKRALNLRELRQALSIQRKSEDEDSDSDDSDSEARDGLSDSDMDDEGGLLASTLGMLYVSSDRSIVRLSHRQAYEYFQKREVKDKWFPDAQEYMAKISLDCLLLRRFAKPIEGDDEDKEMAGRMRKYSFASYAAEFWGAHAHFSQSSQEVKERVQKLLKTPGNFASAIQMAYAAGEEQEDKALVWDARKNANGLHVASWFNLDSLIEGLVRGGIDVDQPAESSNRRTPIEYACRNGSSAAVEKLIELGADINRRDRRGCFPLFQAALTGNVQVVESLVRRPELMIDARWMRERTSLMVAAERGHGEVVTTLLKREELDVDLQDQDGETALHFAAWYLSHKEKAIRALLACKNIDIDVQNNRGRTPLHEACRAGRLENVKLLLDRNANPDILDQYDHTALRQAADEGHKNVIEELYNRKPFTQKSTENQSGESLLHAACLNSRTEVAEWLIGKDFDPNAADDDGKTPLHAAAQVASEDLCSLLLKAGANKDFANNLGQTPVDLAQQAGLKAIVQILDDSVPQLDDTKLRAWALASRGLNQILRERAKQPENDLLDADAGDDTPLHHALRHRNTEAVEILLEAGADVTALNRYKRSPLHEATETGDANLVKLILEHKPPPLLEEKDAFGQTPLLNTIQKDDALSTLALLEAGAAIGDIKPQHDVLEVAIEESKAQVVEKLVQAGLQVKFKDIRLAREKGDADVLRLLNRNKTWARVGEGMAAMERTSSPAQIQDEIAASPDEQISVRDGPDFSKPAFQTRQSGVDGLARRFSKASFTTQTRKESSDTKVTDETLIDEPADIPSASPTENGTVDVKVAFKSVASAVEPSTVEAARLQQAS